MALFKLPLSGVKSAFVIIKRMSKNFCIGLKALLRERGRSILDSRGPLWSEFRAALMFARAVRLRSYDAVFPEGHQAVVADWLLFVATKPLAR
jgi:hypothetical protein